MCNHQRRVSSRTVGGGTAGEMLGGKQNRLNRPRVEFRREESWQRETDGEALTSRAKCSEGTRRSRSGSAQPRCKERAQSASCSLRTNPSGLRRLPGMKTFPPLPPPRLILLRLARARSPWFSLRPPPRTSAGTQHFCKVTG